MGRWPNVSAGAPELAELLERLNIVFNQAGIPSRVTDDIQQELWRKLVV